MAVHHGRHEMPGWRGYLPDAVDRAARKRGAAALRGPLPRATAIGTLAACALAGAAVVHTRSSEPSAPSGTVDADASVLARSAAWTREAGPVLSSITTELRRTDDVRGRWDASSLARGGAPPPRAVVALLERRTALAHHRDALRAAMDTVRAAPSSEVALDSAWPRLRAAQEMLVSLVSGRGALGDPVEATVLRLVLGEATRGAPAVDPPSGRHARGATPREVEDAGTVALAATSAATSAATDEPAGQPSASTAGSIDGPETAETALLPAPSVSPRASADDTPQRAATTDAGVSATDDTDDTEGADGTEGGDEEGPTDRATEGPPSIDLAPVPPTDGTMLTFGRSSPGAAESVEQTASDLPFDAATGGEEGSVPEEQLDD